MVLRVRDYYQRAFPYGANDIAWLEVSNAEFVDDPFFLEKPEPKQGKKNGSSVTSRPLPMPIWPPDLFGFLAKVIKDTEFYTMQIFLDGSSPSYYFDKSYSRRVTLSERKAPGESSSSRLREPAITENVRKLWGVVSRYADFDLLETSTEESVRTRRRIARAMMELIAIADEASIGFGFPTKSDLARLDQSYSDTVDELEPLDRGRFTVMASYYWFQQEIRYTREVLRELEPGDALPEEHVEAIQNIRKDRWLPQIPRSLGMMLDASYCSVLPKSSVPQVGCALRNLTHHIAMVDYPAISSKWRPIFSGPKAPEHTGDNFSVLLIPFPYFIDDGAFRPAVPRSTRRTNGQSGDALFDVEPIWIKDTNGEVQNLVRFCANLIRESEKKCQTVSMIVLPELALRYDQARQLAKLLARQCPTIEMVVCGTVSETNVEPVSESSAFESERQGVQEQEATEFRMGAAPEIAKASRNVAATFLIRDGEIYDKFTQSKHHRWKIDEFQMMQYGLAADLGMGRNWWENSNIEDRSIDFLVFREGTSMSVLVCEDLARFEPVHPIIQSIGPNLLVALLMDGPQLKDRWPGRYATVLGDDPGCSVITLTSVGMIRRSTQVGDSPIRTIGLWKEPGRPSQELTLSPGADGMVLNLQFEFESERTLDGRSDHGSTVRVRLGSRWPVACDNKDLRKRYQC